MLGLDQVLPVVIVKDPYTWFPSMCRHNYAARWPRHKDHCPNLTPNEEVDAKWGLWTTFSNKEKKTTTANNATALVGVPLRVTYHENTGHVTYHDSLAHFWNEWYGDYARNFSHPRLIVRYEDLLFRPESVVKRVCSCVRLDENNIAADKPFLFKASNSKNDKGSNDLSAALRQYGSLARRLTTGYDDADVTYAMEHLDAELMRMFGYRQPGEEDLQQMKRKVKELKKNKRQKEQEQEVKKGEKEEMSVQ